MKRLTQQDVRLIYIHRFDVVLRFKVKYLRGGKSNAIGESAPLLQSTQVVLCFMVVYVSMLGMTKCVRYCGP